MSLNHFSMKFFTSIFALVFLVGIWGNAMAQNTKLWVVANDSKGQIITEAPVENNGTVKFTGTDVEVFDANTVVASIPYEGLHSLTFNYKQDASVNSVSMSSSLFLRNNPVGDLLEIGGFSDETAGLTIVDINGAIKHEVKDWRGEGINVSSLSPGFYFVTVNRTTFKFIKK